ncbi:MAG: deoxyguanosinetriphosphate triphosphohydrolase [Clostridia bacterium]|nr:deoxyguanosinetriphosphate triphosphohydrolase [Clostridia bacterium]
MQWTQLLAKERQRLGRSTSSDLRSPFQKDYHRIIGSASFRRLQDKTQVFPLDKSDFVRTRLTHSLEVSSFSKSLAQSIFETLRTSGHPEITAGLREDVYNILECAGLLHDIGNPPFGHFGESAIREWFRNNLNRLQFEGQPLTEVLTPQMQNDFYYFEGNAQALRLVTKLHFLVDEKGMNLTFALLNTIIKYPVSSTEIDKKSGDIKTKKMGYYHAEEELFGQITGATGAGDCRYPLTFILEAADDIAYKTADIEDAAKKGFLSLHQLLSELKSDRLRGACRTQSERDNYDYAVEKLEANYQNRKQRGVSSPELNALQNWIIYVQGNLLRCATSAFVSNYDAIMEGRCKAELLELSDGNALANALGDIAVRYVFKSDYIIKLEIAAGSIINYLLDRFVGVAIVYDTDKPLSPIEERLMAIVSDNYKYVYEKYSENQTPQEKLYLRLMLVTDFICGMTDNYAKTLYQHLNGMEQLSW